jgi:hypothetical protein
MCRACRIPACRLVASLQCFCDTAMECPATSAASAAASGESLVAVEVSRP